MSNCTLLGGRLYHESTRTPGLIGARVVVGKQGEPLPQALVETAQTGVFGAELLRGVGQVARVVARSTQYRHLGHAHVRRGARHHGAQRLEAVLEVVASPALQYVVVRAPRDGHLPRRPAAVRVLRPAPLPRRRRGGSRSATGGAAATAATDAGTVDDRRRRRRRREAAATEMRPRRRRVGRHRRTLRGRVDTSTGRRRHPRRRRGVLGGAAAVVVHGGDAGEQAARRRQHEQVSHDRRRSATSGSGGGRLQSTETRPPSVVPSLQPPRRRRHRHHVHLITRLDVTRRRSCPPIFVFYNADTYIITFRV